MTIAWIALLVLCLEPLCELFITADICIAIVKRHGIKVFFKRDMTSEEATQLVAEAIASINKERRNKRG